MFTGAGQHHPYHSIARGSLHLLLLMIQHYVPSLASVICSLDWRMLSGPLRIIGIFNFECGQFETQVYLKPQVNNCIPDDYDLIIVLWKDSSIMYRNASLKALHP